jgi:hypothetical protein
VIVHSLTCIPSDYCLYFTLLTRRVSCLISVYGAPSLTTSASASASEEDPDKEPEEEDVLSPLNVARKRQKHFKAVPQNAPLSEAKGMALMSAVNQQLVGRSPQPLNAAPPSLFDETLCNLRYDIHHTNPSHADYAAFFKLRSAMISTYSNESSRKRAFYCVATEFLPGSPRGIEIYDYRTDGALLVNHEKRSFIYLIIEAKNEVGLASAEPGVQAARYYLEHFRNLFEARGGKLDHCVLPVILLCQFGELLSWCFFPSSQTLLH